MAMAATIYHNPAFGTPRGVRLRRPTETAFEILDGPRTA
jgi:hypothetical protein